MNRLKIMLLCLSCVALMTGCWDNVDIEERSIVVAAALDKVPEGFELTLQIPILAKGGGGDSASNPDSTLIVSGKGETLLDALNKITHKIEYPLYLGQNLVIFFGEEVAKDGIKPVLDSLRRLPNIKRNTLPVVVKGKAFSILKLKPLSNPISSFFVQEIIQNYKFNNSKLVYNDLGEIIRDISTNYIRNTIIPYVELKEQELSIIGLALFKSDKMIESLNNDDANAMVNIREKKIGDMLTIDCPCGKGKITFLPNKIKHSLDVRNKVSTTYNISLDGGIIEKTCDSLKLNETANLKLVEDKIAEEYILRADALTTKLQKLAVDPYALNSYVHAYKSDIWKKDDWDKTFKKMSIVVNYKIKINMLNEMSE